MDSSLNKIKFFIKTTGDYKTRDNQYISYSNLINKDTIYLLTEFDLSKNRVIVDIYMKNVLPDKNIIDIFTSYDNFNKFKEYRLKLYYLLNEEINQLKDEEELNNMNKTKIEKKLRNNEQIRNVEKLRESLEFIDEKLHSLKKKIDEKQKNLMKIETIELLNNKKEIYTKKINLIIGQNNFNPDQLAIPYDKILVYQINKRIKDLQNKIDRLGQSRWHTNKIEMYTEQLNDEMANIPEDITLSDDDEQMLDRLDRTNKLDRLLVLKKLEEEIKKIDERIKEANEPQEYVEDIIKNNIEFLKDNLFPEETMYDGSKNVISKNIITIPNKNKKFIITNSRIIPIKNINANYFSTYDADSNYYEYIKYKSQQNKDTHRLYVQEQTTYIIFIELDELRNYEKFKLEQKFFRIRDKIQNTELLKKFEKEYRQISYNLSDNNLQSDISEFINLDCKEKESFLNNQAQALNLPFNLSLYNADTDADTDTDTDADTDSNASIEKFIVTFKEIISRYPIKNDNVLKKELNAVELEVDEYNISHEDEIEQLEQQIKEQEIAKINEEEEKKRLEKENQLKSILNENDYSNYNPYYDVWGGKRKKKTIRKRKRNSRSTKLLKKRNQTRKRK